MTRRKTTKAYIEESYRAYMKSERYQKMNTVRCARVLGVAKTTITRWRLTAGLPPPQRLINEEREKRKIVLAATPEFGLKNKQSTLAIPALCKLVGLPYHTVFTLQKKLGVEPYGQKFRSDAFRQPLTSRPSDLKMLQLAHEWHRPKGMTDHLETLRE